MTTTTTKTTKTNTTLPHPYRVIEPVTGCVVCHGDALARCPRCQRSFCSEHAEVSGCCADCELSLSSRIHRFRLGALSLYTVALSALCCWVAINSDPVVSIVIGAFGILGGIFVSSMAVRVARGADLGWVPVENASLQVNADPGKARAPRRLGHLIAGRSREKDMYQAAYKAGFNRVQGCA